MLQACVPHACCALTPPLPVLVVAGTPGAHSNSDPYFLLVGNQLQRVAALSLLVG
jgi:hypothetical protein